MLASRKRYLAIVFSTREEAKIFGSKDIEQYFDSAAVQNDVLDFFRLDTVEIKLTERNF